MSASAAGTFVEVVAWVKVLDRHRFSYPVRVWYEGDSAMFDRSPLDQPCPRVFIRPEAPPSPAGVSLVVFLGFRFGKL